jgi:uncharacterized protein YdaU (DUF1376 family)
MNIEQKSLEPRASIFINPDEYLRATEHLTTEQQGIHFLLLIRFYRFGLPLPDDNDWLASICKCTAAEWLAAREAVSAFFDIRDGFWYHKASSFITLDPIA